MSEKLKQDPITHTTTSFMKLTIGTDVPEIKGIVTKKIKAARTAVREATIGKVEKIGTNISSAIYDAATGRRRTRSFVKIEENDTDKNDTDKKAEGKITHHQSMGFTEKLIARAANIKNKFGKRTTIVAEDKEMMDFIARLKDEDN